MINTPSPFIDDARSARTKRSIETSDKLINDIIHMFLSRRGVYIFIVVLPSRLPGCSTPRTVKRLSLRKSEGIVTLGFFYTINSNIQQF